MTRFVLVILFVLISSGCGTSDSALIDSGVVDQISLKINEAIYD
ncbi:hypothetical protein AB6D20_013370 [Vibrio splendidus]